MDKPSVMIAIPSGGSWKADFGMSLLGLVGSISRPLRNGSIEALHYRNIRGSILSRSRERLVEEAVKAEVSHLLFLDDDMTFPPATVHKLLDADVGVIAANCVAKVLPAVPTARTKNGKWGGTVLSSQGKKGLEKVWRVGTGVMLINMEVFKKLKKPYFPVDWEQGHEDFVGEDWGFCRLLEKAGITIWVDHDLSKAIQHVGNYAYSMDNEAILKV